MYLIKEYFRFVVTVAGLGRPWKLQTSAGGAGASPTPPLQPWPAAPACTPSAWQVRPPRHDPFPLPMLRTCRPYCFHWWWTKNARHFGWLRDGCGGLFLARWLGTRALRAGWCAACAAPAPQPASTAAQPIRGMRLLFVAPSSRHSLLTCPPSFLVARRHTCRHRRHNRGGAPAAAGQRSPPTEQAGQRQQRLRRRRRCRQQQGRPEAAPQVGCEQLPRAGPSGAAGSRPGRQEAPGRSGAAGLAASPCHCSSHSARCRRPARAAWASFAPWAAGPCPCCSRMLCAALGWPAGWQLTKRKDENKKKAYGAAC